MHQVEKIGDGTEESDEDSQACFGGQASRAADGWEVKVERIDEEGEKTGEEEDVVPVGDDIAARVEDLVAP